MRARCGGEGHVNERTAGAAVAIGERMDRLELGVDESGLGHRWHVVAIDEVTEVVKQGPNEFGRRRNEVGATWVEVVPSEPVLCRSNDSAQFRSRRPVHECAMQRSYMIGVHFGTLAISSTAMRIASMLPRTESAVSSREGSPWAIPPHVGPGAVSRS
jgi:hypothetical protein